MEKEGFFSIELSDNDERSFSRVRSLSTADPMDVLDAMNTLSEIETPRRKKVSFTPIIGAIIFTVFYVAPFYEMYPPAHTCLAILVLAGFCWATEIIPSFATAYIVPLLCVWLGVGYDQETGRRIPANKLAVMFANKFTDPIIFVFLGSLTMSAALGKLNITERVSAVAMRRISRKSNTVLLTIMLINFWSAGFLSNIASTTLTLTFSMPIIRSLDPDDPFIKSLLFGLAWSGNAGGMITTIASSQNILAIKYINESGKTSINFLEWIAFAGPIGLVCVLFFWVYLVIIFKPNHEYLQLDFNVPKQSKWGWKHNFTVAVTAVTIILWALQETFPKILGHVGITSLLPIVLFFSVGILNGSDFAGLRWSTLSLMGGGLALGEAMKVSGLLDLLSDSISRLFDGVPLFWVCMIFLFVQAVIVSVINHTSAAAILFPVIFTIGEQLNHPNLLLTLSAMMIGMAQLFHISSFTTALISGVHRHSASDHSVIESTPFITGSEFFSKGWVTVLGSIIIIGTLGYGIVYGLKL